MVLAKPENKNVLKQFDLHGKVAAVTGEAVLHKPRNPGLTVSKVVLAALVWRSAEA
jgi:hypothetical protein